VELVVLVVVDVDVLVVLDEELVSGTLLVVVCPALGSTPDVRNGITTRAAMSAPDDIRRSLRRPSVASRSAGRRMQVTANTFHVPPYDSVVSEHL
jgi:hypothetical protein